MAFLATMKSPLLLLLLSIGSLPAQTATPIASPELTPAGKAKVNETAPKTTETAPKTTPSATPKATPKASNAWEQGISKVTLLEGGPAIAIPVENAPPVSAKTKGNAPPRVFSPYPVKQLGPLPEGWQMTVSPEIPARVHKVTLHSGRTLEIAVTPPLLQPVRPDAVVVELELGNGQSPEEMLSAIRASQADSRERLEALLETLNAQLPALAEPAPKEESTPAAPR